MLQSITFSGADHTVPRHRLLALCKTPHFPLEFAFLVSEPRMGSARYPSMAVATSLMELVKGADQTVAVHLCGGAARIFLTGTWKTHYISGLTELLKAADRIQINVPETFVTPENIERALQVFGDKTLIFQWRQLSFPPAQPNVQWLYDVSAGQGQAPTAWPGLPLDQMVGLAGGLGPGRVGPLLSTLGRVDQYFWIDMESSLRDREDRFSVDACFKVIEEAHEAMEDLTREENQKYACGTCGNFPLCPCTLEALADD